MAALPDLSQLSLGPGRRCPPCNRPAPVGYVEFGQREHPVYRARPLARRPLLDNECSICQQALWRCESTDPSQPLQVVDDEGKEVCSLPVDLKPKQAYGGDGDGNVVILETGYGYHLECIDSYVRSKANPVDNPDWQIVDPNDRSLISNRDLFGILGGRAAAVEVLGSYRSDRHRQRVWQQNEGLSNVPQIDPWDDAADGEGEGEGERERERERDAAAHPPLNPFSLPHSPEVLLAFRESAVGRWIYRVFGEIADIAVNLDVRDDAFLERTQAVMYGDGPYDVFDVEVLAPAVGGTEATTRVTENLAHSLLYGWIRSLIILVKFYKTPNLKSGAPERARRLLLDLMHGRSVVDFPFRDQIIAEFATAVTTLVAWYDPYFANREDASSQLAELAARAPWAFFPRDQQ